MSKTLKATVVGVRRLNNAQRRALAEIVEKRLGTKVQIARNNEEKLERQIIGTLVKRFKVDSISRQISKLEGDIQALKEARDKLGFGLNYSGDYQITGGDAKALLEAEIKEHSLTIQNVESTRDLLQQRIWLAETVEEAKQVVQEIEHI